ncbi:putative reverse transcriptase domain-containing protein [Tanacetum coccineum]
MHAMPTESNKPPDPLVEEFYTLTKRSSPGNIRVVSPSAMKAKSKRGRPRKSLKGVKPKGSTPNSSSARVGSMLMQLHLSKQAGKARVRNGSSPIDNRGGKRSVKSPVNDEINKVFSDLKSGSINSHFKFDVGTSCEKSASVSTMSVAKGECYVNDGSFINSPLDKCPIENQNEPVAKSSDGITRAKTGFVEGLAGPSIKNEHTSMEDVVNTSVVPSSGLDGVARNKDGCGFKFGSNNNVRGILKKPIGPFFSVQFGRIAEANPFSKKNTGSKDKRWVSGKSSGIGSSMLSNQFTADVDRFAEKLKQGSEELALKMEYSPNSVSKQENGNRRIEFSAEELYKGGQACSLQLYGHFVGTSMDYRVVRSNLMRMWRAYSIEDITKTSSGIFYFKFKSEEGMKSVLDCGPWMVQNVPLVLNIWEPGILVDKSEPSSILIWVCVFNIPMELCNGNGIRKIMSGVGKPLMIDKMTKERCLRKAGKLDYARVLVEVEAVEELPSVLEISYPAMGSRPAKVGKLEVRPRSEEELASKKTGFDNNGGDTSVKDRRNPNVDKDGFTTVGRKNKLVVLVTKSDNRSGVQNRSFNNVKQCFTQKKFVAKQATNTSVNGRGNNQNQRNVDSIFKSQGKVGMNNEGLKNLSKDPNFKPKVLIRGSSSNKSSLSNVEEVIPVRNSFELLNEDGMEQGNNYGGINVQEEFNYKVWLDLKNKVDTLMENGIYHSKFVRMGWTLHQMDYFYSNCQKFHLDPSYEDDEVESETEGIASDMKPEFESCDAMSNGNGAALQSDVMQLLREGDFSLCGLLETKVKKSKLVKICNRVLGRWSWVSNSDSCVGGTRIIVGYDSNSVDVMVMEQSDQVLHYLVKPLNGDKLFYCSFIYAHSHTTDRRSLWKSLKKYKRAIKDEPWIVLGDFNAILQPSKKSMGGSMVTTAMSNFRDCVADVEIEDIAMTGFRYTWNKQPGNVGGLLKKLDRVMTNGSFLSVFPNAKEGFIPMVSDIWKSNIKGYSMYSVVSRLKLLKKPLRKLNMEQGNLFENVRNLKSELARIQTAMVEDPCSSNLREAELNCFKAYRAALIDEEYFLRQKSKSVWLKEGDRNSKYFHNIIRGRLNKGRISMVENMNVKKALFDIDSNKAPGPDGFSSEFFKASWDVVGADLCKAVKEFLCRENYPLLVAMWSIRSLVSGSATVLKKALDEFGKCSGLLPSLTKSTVFFDNVSEATKARILSIIYVNDMNSRALNKNANVSNVENQKKHKPKVRKPKKVGSKERLASPKPSTPRSCLRLGIFVHDPAKNRRDSQDTPLDSIEVLVYWASMFILPVSIANNIERLMRDFLWNFGEFKRGKAKMKWSDVCRPKVEGGLGIRSLEDWNTALISKHIWNLITCKNSLWVKWIHMFKLKGMRFWDILEKEGSSWSWKKILKVRGRIRDHIIHRIGDGRNTSLWFDNWYAICPLSDFISKRNIHNTGLTLNAKVSEVIVNGSWIWPDCLTSEFDGLLCTWISLFPLFMMILERAIWWLLGLTWSGLVNAFQDMPSRLTGAPSKWSDIQDYMLRRPLNKLVWSILQRLLIGAFIYYIWQERNLRTFQGKERSEDVILNLIKYTVRMRIMGLSLNGSDNVFKAAQLWDFHINRGIGRKKIMFSDGRKKGT